MGSGKEARELQAEQKRKSIVLSGDCGNHRRRDKEGFKYQGILKYTMETTIKVSGEVKRHLDKMKIFDRETYNDVIEVLIEDNLELNEKTKTELRDREKEETLSHDEAKKI